MTNTRRQRTQNLRKVVNESFISTFNQYMNYLGNLKVIFPDLDLHFYYLSSELNLDMNLRPQNLDFETYYKLTNEFENLGG